MLDSEASPWHVVLVLLIGALRFSVDLTSGMEWRDLALGSTNWVYDLLNLTLGQSEFILQASTLLLLIIKLFICEFICKSDMCGVLVLLLFLRRYARWVVLGSKPLDL